VPSPADIAYLGTGYCSLAYLRDPPIDELKIDWIRTRVPDLSPEMLLP
jgi:predicted signal transduction protein with EAL and GGDEF domain